MWGLKSSFFECFFAAMCPSSSNMSIATRAGQAFVGYSVSERVSVVVCHGYVSVISGSFGCPGSGF